MTVAPIASSKQTGAVAVAIRLHGVFQNFRTAPSLEAALPMYRRSDGKSEERRRVGTYLRGSGSCSMMNAQPELSLGFFSAFLITCIFIFYPFSSRVNQEMRATCAARAAVR
jgi:hypothetical protein